MRNCHSSMRCTFPLFWTVNLLDRYATTQMMNFSASRHAVLTPCQQYLKRFPFLFQLIIACKKGGTSIEDLAEKFPDMIIKVVTV